MLARYLLVAIGSGLGGMARYGITLWMGALTPGFPWGTILINILGSFVIGFVAPLFIADPKIHVPDDVRVFVMTGLCGGFTTFSAFSLQTLLLIRDGRWGSAAANVLLSVLLCVLATAVGYYAANLVNGAARPPA